MKGVCLFLRVSCNSPLTKLTQPSASHHREPLALLELGILDTIEGGDACATQRCGLHHVDPLGQLERGIRIDHAVFCEKPVGAREPLHHKFAARAEPVVRLAAVALPARPEPVQKADLVALGEPLDVLAQLDHFADRFVTERYGLWHWIGTVEDQLSIHWQWVSWFCQDEVGLPRLIESL